MGINVLSLFDGISCGQLALQRAGMGVDNYFASEIDKHAIKVTQHNFPNTKQIGDVKNINPLDYKNVDLLIGGSPCQSFSFSGKGDGMVTSTNEEILTLERYLELKNENFEFKGQSYLFWEYVRVLKSIQELNPKVKFLLENVVMSSKWEKVITETLGVEPIKLNSSLTSAQNRVRLYWSNFEITEPTNQNINLEDVLEDTEMIGPSAIRGRRLNKATILGRRLNDKGKREDYNKKIPITQCLEVRKTNTNKSNCLTTVAKDTVLTTMPIGRHPDAFNRKLPYRNYTKIERCRLMNLPDDYCDLLSYNQTVKATGNGWEVGMITHIFNCLKKHI